MKFLKLLKLIFRIVLGIVFTFSGFVKSVDPLGFAYKFTDYFVEAFGIPSLSSASLTLAIILSALEFLVGISLLINIKPKLSSIGALLFMIVFTPLTFYIAISSPVEDCGCFGDAIKLSNWATFFKNLVLLPMAIIVFMEAKGQSKTYKGKMDWIVAGAFTIVILLFEYYNLAHLPVIDFRPYSIGTYIPDKMVIPANEKPDSFAIFYTLKNMETGKLSKIDDVAYIDKEIWKDTLEEIVETSEPVLVKKGYSPPIYNLKAYPINLDRFGTQSQDDAIDTILSQENYSFLLVSYDIEHANLEAFREMENLLSYANIKNIETHFLTSSTSGINRFMVKIDFPAKYYNTDPITLKTIVRSNPGLVLLKKGKIIDKWHYNDIPSIKEFESIIKKNN